MFFTVDFLSEFPIFSLFIFYPFLLGLTSNNISQSTIDYIFPVISIRRQWVWLVLKFQILLFSSIEYNISVNNNITSPHTLHFRILFNNILL